VAVATSNVVTRVLDILMSRPETRAWGRRVGRSAASRAGTGGGLWPSLRPNAPRMITVLVAVALTVVGVSLTVHEVSFVNDFLVENEIEITKDQAYLALTASPLLLVAGSLLRGL
jgi:hypothetical protein